MTDPHKTAKDQAKARFDGCVFTGQKPCDGAHILPVSVYPKLADDFVNIVPMHRSHHSALAACFDKYANGSYRDIGEKLYMLQNWTLPEIRQKVKRQIELLRLSCEYHGIPWPEIQEPIDTATLFYSGRLQ